jgi:hypothetical protein
MFGDAAAVVLALLDLCAGLPEARRDLVQFLADHAPELVDGGRVEHGQVDALAAARAGRRRVAACSCAPCHA